MDLLRGLIGNQGNLTEIPKVETWFDEMEKQYLVFICLSVMFSAISVLLGFVHCWFVVRYITNEHIQKDLYWVVFMCPVVALCGSIGMILPRSAIFLYAVALVYFMCCIFVLITLMTTLHGGRQAMCEKLQRHGRRISIRVMPLGCCLFCFEKIEPTEKNFRRIEWLVFQSPVVRIFLEVLNLIVFFELGDRTHLFFQVSNLIGIMSLFLGSYGSYMIIPPGSRLLKAYKFTLMFRIVDLAQLAYSVQKFSFDFLAAVGIFTSGPLLPDTSKGQFYACFLLTVEMVFISVMSTIWFRPSETMFFDKYHSTIKPIDSIMTMGPSCNDVEELSRSDPLQLAVEDIRFATPPELGERGGRKNTTDYATQSTDSGTENTPPTPRSRVHFYAGESDARSQTDSPQFHGEERAI